MTPNSSSNAFKNSFSSKTVMFLKTSSSSVVLMVAITHSPVLRSLPSDSPPGAAPAAAEALQLRSTLSDSPPPGAAAPRRALRVLVSRRRFGFGLRGRFPPSIRWSINALTPYAMLRVNAWNRPAALVSGPWKPPASLASRTSRGGTSARASMSALDSTRIPSRPPFRTRFSFALAKSRNAFAAVTASPRPCGRTRSPPGR